MHITDLEWFIPALFIYFFFNFELIIFNQNIFTWSSSDKQSSLWWCMLDFSNHSVRLSPTPFSQTTAISHSDLLPSNQQLMDKLPHFSFFLIISYIWIYVTTSIYCDFKELMHSDAAFNWTFFCFVLFFCTTL